MWARCAILAATVWSGNSSGAAASPSCDAVAKAMLLVGEQPILRQRTYDGSPPKIVSEAISVPDAMYLREGGGPWRKVPLDQARRRQLAEQALKALPLSECSGPDTVMQDGVAMQLYRYRTPNPLEAGTFSPGLMWVGRDGGLPRRIGIGPDGYQTIEYDGVSVPTDVIEPRQKRPAR